MSVSMAACWLCRAACLAVVSTILAKRSLDTGCVACMWPCTSSEVGSKGHRSQACLSDSSMEGILSTEARLQAQQIVLLNKPGPALCTLWSRHDCCPYQLFVWQSVRPLPTPCSKLQGHCRKHSHDAGPCSPSASSQFYNGKH